MVLRLFMVLVVLAALGTGCGDDKDESTADTSPGREAVADGFEAGETATTAISTTTTTAAPSGYFTGTIPFTTGEGWSYNLVIDEIDMPAAPLTVELDIANSPPGFGRAVGHVAAVRLSVRVEGNTPGRNPPTQSIYASLFYDIPGSTWTEFGAKSVEGPCDYNWGVAYTSWVDSDAWRSTVDRPDMFRSNWGIRCAQSRGKPSISELNSGRFENEEKEEWMVKTFIEALEPNREPIIRLEFPPKDSTDCVVFLLPNGTVVKNIPKHCSFG